MPHISVANHRLESLKMSRADPIKPRLKFLLDYYSLLQIYFFALFVLRFKNEEKSSRTITR